MKETLIIAGFGGQGVLSMGKILAYSGVMQDFEVTWMPSYGPEMRGGTANVTVILSDRKISSPIAHEFDTAIILNQQSMEKFEPMVKPGGTLILIIEAREGGGPAEYFDWAKDLVAGTIERRLRDAYGEGTIVSIHVEPRKQPPLNESK